MVSYSYVLIGVFYNVDAGSIDFLGIPYAKGPLGDLRWATPQFVASWDGIKIANESQSACMQPSDPNNSFTVNEGNLDGFYSFEYEYIG